jgi:hypothetical protein
VALAEKATHAEYIPLHSLPHKRNYGLVVRTRVRNLWRV